MRNRVLALVVLLVLLGLASLATRSAPARAQSGGAWRMVGQTGGPTQAVDVQGDYAYVGTGLRLIVLDVSDPANPTEAGSTTPFPYVVEDIVVSGTLAYVAAGGAGLCVVDVSDPADPVELGDWDSSGYAEGVAAAGTTVYLADGPYGLRVVDASDPAYPRPVGAAYDMNYAFEVAVSGHHAYVAAAGAGLLVADVSDPAHPVEVGALDTPGYAYGVAVSGTLAYVAAAWGGVRVVDISNPAHPVEIGAAETPGWALAVAVTGSSVYVADGVNGVRVLDVADPAHPREAGACQVVGSSFVRRVAVQSGRVYAADLRAGLRLIDATDRAHPRQVGLYGPLLEARYVSVVGSHAYVAAGYTGLRVLDVSDPAHPREVGRYSFENGGDYASGVVVDGAYAYVAALTTSPYRMRVLDISDPQHPAEVGSLYTDGMFREIAVQGHVVYAADEFGLRLIDVSDPASPTEMSRIWLAENQQATTGLAVSGTLAYVAGAQNGVQIVDVSNPYSLTLVAVYDSPGGCAGVAVSPARLYVADGGNGVQAVDISKPAQPLALGSWDTPGYAAAVGVLDQVAYVSDGGGGVQMVDVSSPQTLTSAGEYDTAGNAYHARVAGGYLYVADGRGGLLILEQVNGLASPQAGPRAQPPGPALNQALSNLLELAPMHALSLAGMSEDSQTSPQHARIDVARFQGVAAARIESSESPSGSVSLVGGNVRSNAATCVVRTAADRGDGTLRQCLATIDTGASITFDPSVFSPLAPVTIVLESELPVLTSGGVTVDGSAAGVILDGRLVAGEPVGFRIGSDGNVLRGLQVVGFRYGVLITEGSKYNQIGGNRLEGSGPVGRGNVLSGNGSGIVLEGEGTTGNWIVGNLIGTDASGTRPLSNREGLSLTAQAAHNRVGGTGQGEKNVISANLDHGISVGGSGTEGNIIAGNYIGTDITGSVALPNRIGIAFEGGPANNVVGGTGPGESNVISGNAQFGIMFSDAPTTQNAVIGNLIGTDATGLNALGNWFGLSICGVGFNRVGGGTPEERNVISGNSGRGISVCGGELSDNLVLGNLIGTDVAGTEVVENGAGISLDAGVRHSFFGGATTGEGNLISGNILGIGVSNAGTEYNLFSGNWLGTNDTGTSGLGNGWAGIEVSDYARHNIVQGNTVAYLSESGVRVVAAQCNTVRRNVIHSNQRAGIVLVDGGNGMLPAPVVSAATRILVTGGACPGCTVEIFSDEGDEGRVYEGTTVADAQGRFSFAKLDGLTGPFITATATDNQGNTSPFSGPRAVGSKIYLPVVLAGW